MSESSPADDLFDALPPIFRECVDTYSIMYALSYPWHVNGFIYASDGRLAVRIPATPDLVAASDLIGSEGRRPKVEELFTAQPDYRPESVPIPEVYPFIVCPACRGFGFRLDEGSGSTWTCMDCEGDRVVKEIDRTEIATGFALQSRYAGLLGYFGVSLYLPVEPGPEKQPHPLRFTIDAQGVEGLIMPLLPASCETKGDGR